MKPSINKFTIYISNKFRITIVLFLLIGFVLISSNEGPDVEIKLNIRYTLNYPEDTWQNNKTGLLWALSYLGAELPKNSFDSSILWIDQRTFKLNFKTLGFNMHALQALKVITDSLKTTKVYKKQQAIDLGHFITITLGSSWHYYQITNAPKTYSSYLSLSQFSSYETMALTHSSISNHHRVLKINLKDSVQKSVFIAEEGNGDVSLNTFKAKEFEVMDIMKNGQLRFMIYNEEGYLVPSGNKAFGMAGKPVKCIWCHEINIQPLFNETDSIKGLLTPTEFSKKIKRQNTLLKAYRSSLNSEIDFNKLQDHTYQELIYISFMEPSKYRLSQEWNMRKRKLSTRLKNKTSHVHHEFSFLGKLYERKDIRLLSKYDPGNLPSSIREENETEPNYFKYQNE